MTQAQSRRAANQGRVQVSRGVATIPLAGIDVPFHSSLLLPGVAPFRECLYDNLSQTRIDLPDYLSCFWLQQKFLPRFVRIMHSTNPRGSSPLFQ